MSAPVRTAVVGAGWWSTYAHLPALRADPRSDLVAVCDHDPTRAETAARAFEVAHVVTDVSELIGEVDAAVVATPQGAHHAPAAILLDHGIDTLVEKPLAVTAAEAWDLVHRAERSGARLHVGNTFPYHPAVKRAQSFLSAGRIGEPLLSTGLFSTAVAALYRGDPEPARAHTGALTAPAASTYADPDYGGHLYSQLSHAVALLLFVLGEPITQVSAQETRAGRAVDVADSLTMTTRQGTVVSVAGSGSVHQHDERVEEYRFFGEDATLLVDTVTGAVELREAAGRSFRSYGDVDLAPLPARQLVTAFLGGEVVAPGRLGAAVAGVLEATRASARRGGAPMKIEEQG